MASGETTPFSNTLAPSRVTSRSSCSTFSSCCWTRAIFNRQELEPMSIAAYVCILGGVLPGNGMRSAMQDTPLLLHYLQAERWLEAMLRSPTVTAAGGRL